MRGNDRTKRKSRTAIKKINRKMVNKTGIKLEPTHMTKQKIDVQGHEPIKQRYYHVSPKLREYMYEEIDKMMSKKNCTQYGSWQKF